MVPFFLPFIPLHPGPPHPPAFPLTLSSCPWVIHISSSASPFPILFLTSPCLFCTYQLYFLFPVHFPPTLPLLLPTDNPPCALIAVILFLFSLSLSLIMFLYFLGSVVDSYFIVHSFDHLLFLRQVPLKFHIIRTW